MDRQQEAVHTDLAGFGPPQWIPKPYQTEGVDRLLNTVGALFFKPGLGKTSTTLMAFKRLRELDLALRMLVVAPLKVAQTTWIDEPKKFAQFAGFKVGLAHGLHKIDVLEDLSNDIVVINYEGLLWLSKYLDRNHLDFDVICYDELTKMKNHRSKRFRAFRKHMDQFTFRWGLTGTPVANGVLQLFGQIYCLDQGERLGKYVTHFRNKYAYTVPWDQHNYYVKPEQAEVIMAKISDIAHFVSKEDWLDLPPLTVVTREAVISKKLAGQYSFFEDEFLLKLEDTVITAANAGVLTSKLRQFTGGAVYDEERKWSVVHTEKIELLKDLVDELSGDPLIVAYQFDHERERLLVEYPNALVFKGGMSKNATAETMSKWSTGQHPIMLVQPASASMGLNLQFGGHNICWFSLTYNLEEFEQMNDRLHRTGQKEPVICHILTLKGTIDEQVAKVLRNKDATQVDLLNCLQK